MNKLTHTIASAIAEAILDTGDGFSITLDVDGQLVDITGTASFQGHSDDDYTSGTGAWVADGVSVWVAAVEAFDEDGEPVAFECDRKAIENEAEGLLLRAYA